EDGIRDATVTGVQTCALPISMGLPYLDKPIVYFAASAGAMALLGPTELAARLPACLATLATIALLVWFARRRWGEDAGWLAGLEIGRASCRGSRWSGGGAGVG